MHCSIALLPDPTPRGRDLLRRREGRVGQPGRYEGARALGAHCRADQGARLGRRGVVQAVGADATLFKPGDRVWYAGSLSRPGTNSELHLVDERIVGPMPRSLDFAQAAALPLTSITGVGAAVRPLRRRGRQEACWRSHSDRWRRRRRWFGAGAARTPPHGTEGDRRPPRVRPRGNGCWDSAPMRSSTTADRWLMS